MDNKNTTNVLYSTQFTFNLVAEKLFGFEP